MAITIRECPHCYTRAGFLEDGACPACGKNLADPGGDPGKTLLTVSLTSAFPAVCISCGGSTTRRVVVSQGTRSRAMGFLAVLREILGYCLAPIIRGGFIGMIYHRDQQRHPHQRVRVSIPLCPTCRKTHGVPKPDRVDFEHGTISFLISRNIATRLSQQAANGHS